ncbi:MAG: dicarboxylate/amino acid:cation symporter [Gemmatirosa sp.]|nr:dicarboxylate/amino acid:cation symporter [Gemmatirosa sp.]
MKESTRVLVALGAALALGAAIGASGSAPLVRTADALAPLGTLWVNAIRMTVVPLVVALLVTGVTSAADVRSVGRLGGRSLVVFVLLLAANAAVVLALMPALFSLLPAAGARPPLPPGAAEAAGQVAASQAQTVGAWLVSLVPTNPVAAAAGGAMLQLVLFTLVFALAVTRIAPASRAAIVGLFHAVGDAMLVLVGWIIALAPLGVFALVLPLAAHVGAGLVGGIGFYVLAYSVGSVVLTVLLYPVVGLFGAVSASRFGRGVLEPQLIALSSSSSMATLPAMVRCAERPPAERGLGLSAEATGFVLPLAASTFKIAGPVSWTTGALFVAWFYGVPLHARELATIAFAAVFLAFGVPGVPRGAFIMLAPLFVAIGLPPEGIGLLIAVDAIPDTFATVLNVTGNLAAAALVDRKTMA